MNPERKPNTQTLNDRYNVAVVDDVNDSMYRPVVVVLTSRSPKCYIVEPKDGESASIHLAAIVCDDVALCGVNYPIGIKIFNGDGITTPPLDGKNGTNFKGTHWADVILPGTQHGAHHILFEPGEKELTYAREYFPDVSDEDSQRGIRIGAAALNSKTERWILYTGKDEAGEIICPLGFVLALQQKNDSAYGVKLVSDNLNGVNRPCYFLPKSDAQTALESFRRDSKDPRPLASLKTLQISATALAECTTDFVLTMKLGMFFYDA